MAMGFGYLNTGAVSLLNQFRFYKQNFGSNNKPKDKGVFQV